MINIYIIIHRSLDIYMTIWPWNFFSSSSGSSESHKWKDKTIYSEYRCWYLALIWMVIVSHNESHDKIFKIIIHGKFTLIEKISFHVCKHEQIAKFEKSFVSNFIRELTFTNHETWKYIFLYEKPTKSNISEMIVLVRFFLHRTRNLTKLN